MKFRGLQRLTPLAVQIRPAWAPAPQAWPLQVPTAGTPLAHLASHSLKGCGVTSQKLDSSVYSPNTETALWALLRHPDPVPPQGKRGFQPIPRLGNTWHAHLQRPTTRRNIQPGPAAGGSQVRHKKELSATKGHSAQRQGNLLKCCALLVRTLGPSV